MTSRLACGDGGEQEPSEIRMLIVLDEAACKEIHRVDDKQKKLKGAPPHCTYLHAAFSVCKIVL